MNYQANARSARGRATVGACLSAAGLSVLAVSSLIVDLRAYAQPALFFVMSLAIVSVGVVWSGAFRDGQFLRDRHEHVSGWSALLLLMVIAGVWGLGVWASNAGVIDARLGLLVLGFIASLFALTAVASDVLVRAPKMYVPVAHSIGRLISVLDAFAVFVLAPLAGARERNIVVRYALGISTMVSCGALAIVLPAPWGLVPIAWAFLVTAGVVRRWAWVEEDRNLFVRYGDARNPRVGFEQNLLDEALLMTLLFFFLIPIGYTQLQSVAQERGHILFSTPASVDLVDWYQFFGTEMAKAAPLLDWTEVYNVRSASSIVASTPMSQHVVFVTRASFDFVLFGVLLQALATLQRNQSRQQILFEGYVGRVDPFVERDLLYALVRRDGAKWVPNERLMFFPQYDEDRLEELSLSLDARLRAAAEALLSKQHTESRANRG